MLGIDNTQLQAPAGQCNKKKNRQEKQRQFHTLRSRRSPTKMEPLHLLWRKSRELPFGIVLRVVSPLMLPGGGGALEAAAGWGWWWETAALREPRASSATATRAKDNRQSDHEPSCPSTSSCPPSSLLSSNPPQRQENKDRDRRKAI